MGQLSTAAVVLIVVFVVVLNSSKKKEGSRVYGGMCQPENTGSISATGTPFRTLLLRVVASSVSSDFTGFISGDRHHATGAVQRLLLFCR